MITPSALIFGALIAGLVYDYVRFTKRDRAERERSAVNITNGRPPISKTQQQRRVNK